MQTHSLSFPGCILLLVSSVYIYQTCISKTSFCITDFTKTTEDVSFSTYQHNLYLSVLVFIFFIKRQENKMHSPESTTQSCTLQYQRTMSQLHPKEQLEVNILKSP